MKALVFLIGLFFNIQLFAAPQANLTTLEGKTVSSQTIKGKWLILQYWANWCEICMGELPHVQKLYQDIDKSKVNLYMVNFDGLSKRQVNRIFANNHVTVPSLKGDPAGNYGIHGINALPVMIIVNPEGHVAKVLYGPQSERKILNIVSK